MIFRIAAGLLALVLLVPAGYAQRVYRVGVLNFGGAPAPGAPLSAINDSLVRRLGELGFRDRKNLALEWRWADTDLDRVEPLTNELVQARVDVVVTVGNKIQPLVTRANARVPIVSLSCDAFNSVASYARPDGNFAGVTCMSTELSPKRLEFAKLLVPGASRFVYLHNPNQGATGLELSRKAASALGVKLTAVEMRGPTDFDQALAAIAAQRPQALLVYPDTVTMRYRKEIADFALAQKVPAVFAYREYAEAGGLASYGLTLQELGERGAELTARILRGSKPSELPLQQATRVYLTINLKSARDIGYMVPTALLQRADFVIDSD